MISIRVQGLDSGSGPKKYSMARAVQLATGSETVQSYALQRSSLNTQEDQRKEKRLTTLRDCFIEPTKGRHWKTRGEVIQMQSAVSGSSRASTAVS